MKVNNYLSCVIETVTNEKYCYLITVYKEPYIFDTSDRNLFKQFQNYIELKNEGVTIFKISFDNFNKIVNDLDYETNKLNNFNYTLFKMLQLKLEKINESLQDIFIELNLKFTYNAGS